MFGEAGGSHPIGILQRIGTAPCEGLEVFDYRADVLLWVKDAAGRYPYPNRLSDEELVEELRAVDKLRKGKGLQEARTDVLTWLSEGFGVTSLVRSLDNFTLAANLAITAHPNSARAFLAGRLCYLSAAIATASPNYVSAEAAFRSV